MPPKPPILPPGVAGLKGLRRGIGQPVAQTLRGFGNVVPNQFAIGASTVVQRIFDSAPTTGTLNTPTITTQPGSAILVGVSRGVWANAARPNPFDSLGDAFNLIGTTHAYSGFPSSLTGAFVDLVGSGGLDFASADWGFSGASNGDEVTIYMVEILGVNQFIADSWIEPTPLAGVITTNPVTTTGPAVLICAVWGDGPVGQDHTFTATNGFTKIPTASAETDFSPSGYIQLSVFYKIVDAAGTYTGSFIGVANESAQLHLMAFQPGAGAQWDGADDQPLYPRPQPAAMNQVSRAMFDDSDLPIVASTTIVEDDGWIGALVPRRVPAPAISAIVDLDDVPAGALFGQLDEDFSTPPFPAPVAATFSKLYLPDPEELAAGSLLGQPSEEPWFTCPAPAGASFGRLYLPDGDDFVLPPASLVVDEDFYATYPLPAVSALYQKQPFVEVDEVPAALLFGQYDEDLWTAAPAPAVATLFQRLPLVDDDVPSGSLFGQYEEDAFSVWPAPATAQLRRLHLPDPDELPGGALFGQYDEDQWVTYPLAQTSTVLQRLPLLFDPEDEIAGLVQPTFWTDEDLWLVRPAPIPATTQTPASNLFVERDDMPAGALRGQYDEDVWSLQAQRPPVAQPPALLGIDDGYAPALSASDEGLIVAQPWATLPMVAIFDASDEDSYAAPGVGTFAAEDFGWQAFSVTVRNGVMSAAFVLLADGFAWVGSIHDLTGARATVLFQTYPIATVVPGQPIATILPTTYPTATVI